MAHSAYAYKCHTSLEELICCCFEQNYHYSFRTFMYIGYMSFTSLQFYKIIVSFNKCYCQTLQISFLSTSLGVSSNTLCNWKHFEKYRALNKWGIVINLISLYHPLWIHHPSICCINGIINWGLVALVKETHFQIRALYEQPHPCCDFYFTWV